MESEGYIRIKADASISSKDFYAILSDVVRGKLSCTAEIPQLQRRHGCQCREVQSGALQ